MIDHRVKEQLALEFNCCPEDFDHDENVITRSCLHENRRKFSNDPFFLQMATFGRNAVISADEEIHRWHLLIICSCRKRIHLILKNEGAFGVTLTSFHSKPWDKASKSIIAF